MRTISSLAVSCCLVFDSSGQNIANGDGIQSWNFTFQLWDQEAELFTIGQSPCVNFEQIGHFTQVKLPVTHLCLGALPMKRDNDNRRYYLYYCMINVENVLFLP